MSGVIAALAEHAFKHLFIECLGWDRLHGTLEAVWKETTLQLTAIAHKRGFTVLHCSTHRTVLLNRRILREIQRQVRRTYHEHIIIYSCDTTRKQVWQWVIEQAGRRLRHRELPFLSHNPPRQFVERVEKLKITPQEEEQTTLPDVLHRVRTALLPVSESNMFARYPTYAVESDRLAMAMKRGEPGAMQAFVQFHMKLAQQLSKRLLRWFTMTPEDAEQTAMIGLIQGAQRFDPDKGFQFSTYASHWIRQACQRFGPKWGLLIQVPMHLFWQCYKLEFVEAELMATHGQDEAARRFEAVLEEDGIPLDRWHRYQQARSVYCFSEIDRRQRFQLDRPDPSQSNRVEEVDALIPLERGLAALNPRYAQVLKLRYGIGQPECTLKMIGEILGLTRERVRQIQVQAEKKLICFLKRSDRFGIYKEQAEEATDLLKTELGEVH